MKPHHLIVIALALLTFPSTARAAIRTWDGGGVGGNFSTAANWVGDVAPVANDDLVFPAAATKKGRVTNTAAETYRSITIESGGYVLDGQAVTLTNGITATYTTGVTGIELPLVIPNAQTFTVQAAFQTLVIQGTVTIANVLTLAGPGNFNIVGVISGAGSLLIEGAPLVILDADNTFAGGVTINSGRVSAEGTGASPATGLGLVTIAGGALSGAGATRDVHCNVGGLTGGQVSDPFLDTQSVVMTPDCTFAPSFVTATAAQGLRVTGTVTLGDAIFIPQAFVTPTPNVPVVIIDNDGNDPVVGTFAGIPEGGLGRLGDFRVSYQGGDGNDVVLTVVEADLSLTHVASNPSPIGGQNVTFTLTASNAGPSTATNVTVADTLPAGLTFVSATPTQGTCSSTSPIDCSLGEIAAGGSAQIAVVAKVAATGALTTNASINSDVIDRQAGNDSASATINAAVGADLSVTNTVSDSTPSVGQEVTFNLTVSNAGPSPATVVNLTDTLPVGLTLVRAGASQGTCTGTGPVVCALGTIANGGTAQVSIVARVAQTGQFTNSARVAAAESDPTAANDTASVTVDAAAAAAAQDVPALDGRALAALAVLLVVAGVVALRR